MSEKIREQNPEMQPPQDPDRSSPDREKEISNSDQSSNEAGVEKSVTRQRRAEVQNPLMHESY